MSELTKNQAAAAEKLQSELKSASNKEFADLVIGHLMKRCQEDDGLAEDVSKEGKSWIKCYEYIFSLARKAATQNRAVVISDTVFEWAEDYYRMTAEQEKKANIPEKPDNQHQERKSVPKPATKHIAKKADKMSSPEKKKAEPKKGEVDGQISLFDLMEE